MNVTDYKGVWVFAEQREGILKKVSLELLGEGKTLANKLGVKLTALLLGNNIRPLAEELAAYGADEVLVADDVLLQDYTTDGYTKVICELAKDRKPEIIMIGATYIGRDLGPRVAARLSTGLTADCTSIDIEDETRNLMATRPAFGGNLMATIACPNHRPQMATVRPGVFEKLEKNEDHHGVIERVNVALVETDIRTKVIETVVTAKELVDIGAAEFIVSGGRGVGSVEGFKILAELADLLGGTVGGSRAAVDKEWIGKHHQVGQTGQTVKPKVYIACGISGAVQHLAGMQDSDYIIAINKDDAAPIMKIANIAIVGDLYKVVPEMIAHLKAE